MRLIEGFNIDHDATIVKELQERFEIESIEEINRPQSWKDEEGK
jgi:hypothetical protein